MRKILLAALCLSTIGVVAQNDEAKYREGPKK
jgi:hypothetical protein